MIFPAGHSLSPPQGVGKSCLALRFSRGTFDAASRATVGAAFLTRAVALPDGRTTKLEVITGLPHPPACCCCERNTVSLHQHARGYNGPPPPSFLLL